VAGKYGPAFDVGPRLGAAEQLDSRNAARPAEVSPRFADGGARRFVLIAKRGLAKCGRRRARAFPSRTVATGGNRHQHSRLALVLGLNSGGAPRRCSTAPLRGRNLPDCPSKEGCEDSRSGEHERGRTQVLIQPPETAIDPARRDEPCSHGSASDGGERVPRQRGDEPKKTENRSRKADVSPPQGASRATSRPRSCTIDEPHGHKANQTRTAPEATRTPQR
jgi:hypothetical protein